MFWYVEYLKREIYVCVQYFTKKGLVEAESNHKRECGFGNNRMDDRDHVEDFNGSDWAGTSIKRKYWAEEKKKKREKEKEKGRERRREGEGLRRVKEIATETG